MQQTQINNLLQLVRTSNILDQHERQEWLALIDLMNDKQLFELEKILSKPKQVKPEPVKSAPLHLSHILNIPQHSAAPKNDPAANVFKDNGKVVNTVAPIIVQQNSSASSKFKAKLASLFAKRDLTTNKPEYPKELLAHNPQTINKPLNSDSGIPEESKQVTQKKTVNFAEKPVTPPKVPRPQFSGMPKLQPTQPSAAHKPASVIPQIKPAAVGVMTTAQPMPEKPKFEHLHVGQSTVLQKISKPDEPIFQSGLQNTNMLVNARLMKNATASPTFPGKPQTKFSGAALENAEAKPVNLAPIELNTVQDLAHVDLSFWKRVDYEEMIKKFKDIIKTFGYHEFMFGLEHSPLYNTYVETGIKMLKENVSFESLEKEPGPLTKRYLTRAEFERFTDILRQVQSG